ncbi:MAG TPA: enoyl-CoA hydratase [Deltaproteobacteria bacterium]|nr:enoyl-CoA hydratase [Deltaproteobacteria bacterium]HCP48449.1 enoyl-CoA hydratase [Deltaproteobacteria bacterium]
MSAEQESELPPFKDVLYEVDGHVLNLCMNRPTRRNALSVGLVNELIVALETARDDPSIGAIVLSGAGGAFCSGGDISQMSGGAEAEDNGMPFRGGFVELNLAFTQVGKPIIAKVQRYAYGGGLGLVCASQFAIAEEGAKFGTPEIDRGLFPMMIMANILRMVPRREALELMLTGERISATRAAEIGLINRAVPADDLDSEVDALAKKLASKSPQVLALGLQAFYQQADMDLVDALPYLQDMLLQCFSTDDAREGMMAFMEKREPRWSGR